MVIYAAVFTNTVEASDSEDPYKHLDYFSVEEIVMGAVAAYPLLFCYSSASSSNPTKLLWIHGLHPAAVSSLFPPVVPLEG